MEKSKIKHDFSQIMHTVFSLEYMFEPIKQVNLTCFIEVPLPSKDILFDSSILLPFLTFT